MTEPLFRYVALGDSTAVGVGGTSGGYPEHLFQRLRKHGVPAGILNLGRSGATTDALVQEQLSGVARRRPALVTVGIGTNDLWRMVPLERIRENFLRVADALSGLGAQVLVSNVSDLSLAPVARQVEAITGITRERFVERLDALNQVIAEAAARPDFTLVDVCTFSRSELPDAPDYFCADGFHPSDLGYRRWAELLWPHAEQHARTWLDEAA